MKQPASKECRIWILVAVYSLSLCCHTTRAQQGFVSIDCGATTSYVDTNVLTWTPDKVLNTIANAGNATTVTPPTNADAPAQFSTIRYFPGDQTKYCYVFNNEEHGVIQGNAYLVRASFWAGATVPYKTRVKDKVNFKLLMYADQWDEVLVMLPQTGGAIVKEMYVVAMKETIDVCVAGSIIGMDIPFISSLVLRPLFSNMSSVRLMNSISGGRPLSYMHRINYGAPSADTVISYLQDGSGDPYDRVWQPDTRQPIIATTSSVSTDVPDHPPIKVMQTAYQSDDSFNLTFTLPSNRFYYFCIYLSEISLNVSLRGQRVFEVQLFNGTNSLSDWATYDLYEHEEGRFGADTRFSKVPTYVGNEGFINFAFTKLNGSIYGPIVNGLELLQVSDHDIPLGTDDDEVATLKKVTSTFSSMNSWSGDPCLPYAYNWLTCTSSTRPFIFTISLSNKSLEGEIPTGLTNFKALVELSLAENKLSGSIPDLSSLQFLEVLDLHGNYLSGEIPTFLGQLSSLKSLNLDSNNFSGQIPSILLAKASSSGLKFSFAGNPNLCNEKNNEEYCTAQSPTSGHSNGALVAGVALVCAIAALAVVGVLVFCIVKHKKKIIALANDPFKKQALPHADILGISNQAYQFTFQSIITMTRNFERILGKGGFGPVYHGVLENGKNVAVKLLAKESRQGEQEFLNEVKLLSRVHHKNLVSLVGYCTECQLVLVYEYMAKGSLFEALRGEDAKLVAWRDRLHIAMDAAAGLDYLHRGCHPSIIHRDVKSSNILLNEEFEGKISDFGISKSKQYNTSTMGGGSQTFTVIRGSFGYLDPVYAETNIATHSIDVYAFGIVLFELITGMSPVIPQLTKNEHQHILQWAKPLIEQGDVSRLVDPNLNNDFNVSSMWKVIDVAMMCVEHDRRSRPNMQEVTLELKSALSMELQINHYDTNASDQQSGFTYTIGVSAR